MQVATYISDLLYRHDCVVIPEFGALLSRRIPAQHFASSHTIYPPKKGLSFNAQITQNDGLLVNYIASVEQIPYEVALQQARNYVRFLNQEIDDKEAVTIHKVGRFSRNSEGSMQFTPMYLVNYLPEAFGLSSHETYAVDRSFSTGQEPIKELNLSGSIEDGTPVIQLETPATKNASWVRYAAAAVFLIGGSYAGFTGHKNYLNQSTLLVEQMADQQVKAKVQQASFIISNPLPSLNLRVAAVDAAIDEVVKPEYVNTQNFHVIAGAFRSPVNANTKVRELQKLGYSAQRIGVNKYGLHNVAFSSFNSRNEATNALITIKATGFTNAWLLVGRLQ
jgi:hypothetical protein